jgi:formylglycine-generating enzyme
LYDIIGNVYEWCSDNYSYAYYTELANNNPTGPIVGEGKVLRGGSCYDGAYPSYLRSATRFSYFPTTNDGMTGFRCVMDVSE